MDTLGDLEAQLIVEIDGSQHYDVLTNPVGVGDTILRELEMARA
jgi:very-short-patch-repair endonuclease